MNTTILSFIAVTPHFFTPAFSDEILGINIMADGVCAVSDRIQEIMGQVSAHSDVRRALAWIHADVERTIEEQIELTEIAAPSFQEALRGERFKEKLEALFLEDVCIDPVGNVTGIRRGVGDGPTLLICAHLDTVFPAGTDVSVKRREGRLFAPGIADDGRGLATVLGLARALQESGIKTRGDILFGATVGEEGLGDLRGVKALFGGHTQAKPAQAGLTSADYVPRIDGFISIEPGSPSRTTYLATGSRRYRITFHGQGGHSFGDFGTPSAIHALGRAIANIADLRPPRDPKTTFNVGEISGGTSVNTIAQRASMLLDLRSNSLAELSALEEQALCAVRAACDEENRGVDRPKLRVEIEKIGDRPAGEQSPDAPIVRASLAAARVLGLEPVLDQAQSTDANVPIQLGIPSVTLGGGGDCGGMHTLEEFFDPRGSHVGVQHAFLTMLALVGVRDAWEPLLENRSASQSRSLNCGADETLV